MSNATSTAAAPFPGYTPSVIILNAYSQDYVNRAAIQIAPWVMGTFADFFLQGIMAAQVANYFNFRDVDGSKSRFTWLIVVLIVLCTIKSAQNVTIVWQTVISNFANPDVSSLLVATNWIHYSTSLTTAIIATYVQSFFVYRYWMLTRRWYICLVMAIGMVVSLIGSALVIVLIPQLQHEAVRVWSLVHFIAAIIVDSLITICTAIHLQSQKTSIKSTADLINRLIRMTWQSALPPTICVIINAALLESLPLQLPHIAFNTVLPMLYAISLLYTLNLRNELRGERMTSHERSTGSRTGAGIGKQSFIPGGNTYRGAGVSNAGIGNAERGVSFIGKGRGMSFNNGQSRKMDGIHVETQITRDGGSSGNTMELRSFGAEDVKSIPAPDSDFDREVWEPEKQYNAR